MSTGFTSMGAQYTLRTDIWSAQMQQNLYDELIAMRWVKHLTDFPDGTTFHIPMLGDAEIADFSEGQAVRYNKFDEGEYTFAYDKYQYSANSISEKYKRDSFYAQDVMAAFVPRQHRALMEAVETRIFNRMNALQSSASTNQINGADHRWVGSGTSETIHVNDFAKVRYALKKAMVPQVNLIGIVDPSVAYALETQTNVTNLLTPSPRWGNMVHEGLTNGINFRFNIFGFDIYESNYLPGSIAETISGRTTTTAVANMFFSGVGGDLAPVVGGFRQMPTVQSKFNQDLQQTDFLTICEYGFKGYRSENLCIVLTDNDQV